MKEDNTNQTENLISAIEKVKSSSKTKFVGSIDIDIVLNLREKQRKEVVRGSVNLPNSIGDAKRVIVFADEKDVQTALNAGASKAGLDDLMKELDGGFADFDIVIATPSVMPKIVRMGKVLGPKGLMPNPKNGTITQPNDLEKTINSFKSGRINFKTAQDQGVIRLKIGKVDMETEKIQENIVELLKAVFSESKKLSANPFKKIILSPTMGTGVKVDISDIMQKL